MHANNPPLILEMFSEHSSPSITAGYNNTILDTIEVLTSSPIIFILLKTFWTTGVQNKTVFPQWPL